MNLNKNHVQKYLQRPKLRALFNKEILILKKLEMITTYYPNFKNTHNLKDVKLKNKLNLKYVLELKNFKTC